VSSSARTPPNSQNVADDVVAEPANGALTPHKFGSPAICVIEAASGSVDTSIAHSTLVSATHRTSPDGASEMSMMLTNACDGAGTVWPMPGRYNAKSVDSLSTRSWKIPAVSPMTLAGDT
jgi:hypothetical protein